MSFDNDSENREKYPAVSKEALELVQLEPKERFSYLWGKSNLHKIQQVAVIIAFGSAVISSFDKLKDLLGIFDNFIAVDKQDGGIGALDIVFTKAYSADQTYIRPNYTPELKTVFLSSFTICLFILFIWAIVTLYKSPNARAVDSASEALKLLSGFFIGALTGFLGN